MSKILILLFAFFALTHAVFERTDCSCTCKDGKVCVKAVPNYLEGNTQECQCKDGTCPSGLEFNGKYNTLLEKSNFCPKIQFHELFTQSFLTIFFVISKLSKAKKSKTTTFSRVFHPKKSINLSWIFGQKMKISNSVKLKIFEFSHQKSNNLLFYSF